MKTVERRHSLDSAPLKLAISVITDNKPPENTNWDIVVGPSTLSYGSNISVEGEVSYFSNGSFSRKGSCCSQIEKHELKRIDQLLADLPSDNSFLPPNERRLLLQVAEDDKFVARVYDLANVPDKILELLRLTKSSIRPRVLWLAPETQWIAHNNHPLDGGVAVTSDGRQIITSGLNEPIKVWHTDYHNLLQEIIAPPNVQFNGMILSPDNSIAVIQEWWKILILDTKKWNSIREIEAKITDGKTQSLSKPHFIMNGKYLLLESSEPALCIYDTKTWKRLDTLSQIPMNAVSFYPTSQKNRAVYSLKDGQIILRDTVRQHDIAILDNARIEYVSFSPDKSLVAVVTLHKEIGNEGAKYKIRLWNADNGEFIKELRPFEQDSCESVEGIMWSPDNKYILAATKADVFITARSISVWNAESGRHRGELFGCPTKLNGLNYILSKDKIVVGCGDGIVRIWNLTDAISKISKFEKEVTEK